MSKVKKIGCLDPEALNYDNTAQKACKSCCNDETRNQIETEFIDFMFKRANKNNKVIDYSIYSVGHLDGQPLFNLAGQAESYALQIGCKGYHTHLVAKRLYYMACKTHEQAILGIDMDEKTLIRRIASPIEDFIGCDDYISKIENEKIVWKNQTTYKIQQACCLDKKADGYSWDDIGRECSIEEKKELKKTYNHSTIGTIEQQPVWYTIGAALEYGRILGCEGYNTQNLYKTEGYVACKDLETSKTQSTGINCNNPETLINGDLIFPRVTKTGKMEYLEACCLQWIQHGFFWNSSGCKQLETPLTWSCIDGMVTEIYDGNGDYISFSDAQKECGLSLRGGVTYNCDYGKCVVTRNGRGEFKTLEECSSGCSSNSTQMGEKTINLTDFMNNIVPNKTIQ